MKNNNYKNFLILRPTTGMDVDSNGIPIIKKMNKEYFNKNSLKVTNFKNLNSIIDRDNTILDMFNYDDVLNYIWKDPFKYIAKFTGLLAIASPDFSIYPGMSKYEIEHNVFKSRWTGAVWQMHGLDVIPTVSWAGPETYDICFSGLEKDSVVIISTLGVGENTGMFLNGFSELRKRVNPPLFIVIGKIIDGMEGNFLVYNLIDTFNQRKKFETLSFFDNGVISKEGDETLYGWKRIVY